MNKNGLTLTLVFEAESANYGEGIGNIAVLKKMSRADGNMYSYISRQAMRYNIIQQLGWDNTPVNDDKGTIQFSNTASIKDYPEIDLFGYMKTEAKGDSTAGGAKTRSAVARLSNAISLEPYNSELDFLTNMGLAKRKDLQNGIAQSEIHRSFYSYTVTLDLDKVGVDTKDKIDIPNAEKSDRVCKLLDALCFLFRDIKGRRENMNPVFFIGGVFDRKCPYFEGRVTLSKGKLDVNKLRAVIDGSEDTKAHTVIGYLDSSFQNDEAIKALSPLSISDAFAKIKEKVKNDYAESC